MGATTNILFTWSWAILFKTLIIIEKGGKHKGTDWTRFAALHMFPDCMDLVSMHRTVEVVLTVEKQKGLSLVCL